MKRNNRNVDQSTANFIKAVSAAKNYTPYTLYKMTNDYASFRQFEFICIKPEESPGVITHKFHKIKINNDRSDIFVEGGQVSVAARNKQSSPKTQSIQKPLETFYKVAKSKKKSDILLQNWQNQERHLYSFRHKNKFIHKTQQNSHQEQQSSSIPESSQAEMSFPHRIRNNTQMENKQYASYSSTEHRQRLVSTQKAANSRVNKHIQHHKTRIVANIGKGNIQKQAQTKSKLPISAKPMFYLQAKEISHIKAQSFIVVQYPTRKIVIGNYYKKPYEIASLTKIMTFYTIYKISEKYHKNISQEWIQIDEQSQSMTGTSAEIAFGDIFSIEYLLYGLMLPSGNDAAMALAKWGGKLLIENQDQKMKIQNKQGQNDEKSLWKIFVKQMNDNARLLEMKSTRFGNPHGLPESNSGSTAQDQAILVAECLQIEYFKKVIKAQHFECEIEHKDPETQKVTKHQVKWENTNKLLRRPGFIGVKTGVTATAGPCLATVYDLPKENKQYIIVLLRTTKLSRRFKDTRLILGLGLSKIYGKQYNEQIRAILRNNIELDSDNSEDEQAFCFDKTDSYEMRKRNRILTFQV